jgi:CYTH domain-containing protein
VEIERKFLVESPPPALGDAPGDAIEQGYLVIGEGEEARVRRRADSLTLTVKSGSGLGRAETEIALDTEQFEALWPVTEGRRVVKVRHELPLEGGLVAELDVYAGALEGLSVVEVEFRDEDGARRFAPPAWFSREVTDDERYGNRRLAVAGLPR